MGEPNQPDQDAAKRGNHDIGREGSGGKSVGDAGTLAQAPGDGELIDGRLLLLEKLGEGGMGVVWKARDTRLGRFVALKRPKGAQLNTVQGRARFLREARACAGLAHPNIITIYAVGEDRQGPFIEMEYVEGLSLREEVRQSGPLAEAAAGKMLLALCDALALAHGRGIIHRDIKPANILLTARGVPKLGDFGLAAIGEEEEEGRGGLTASGAMLGTFYYAAPEQLHDAKSIDTRSDIYSLAATAYFMLTGEDPRRLRWERLPWGLRPVIEKALEEDPTHRYPDMKAFEQDLAQPGLSLDSDFDLELWADDDLNDSLVVVDESSGVLMLEPEEPEQVAVAPSPGGQGA